MGGYFDGERYVTGAEAPHEGAGTRAGVRAREREPLKNPHLKRQAKQLLPAGGPREGEHPKSKFESVGSDKDRRDLMRAAEFVASMDGRQAHQYRAWLADEQGKLDEHGPAESAREENRERIALTLGLADDVEAQAAEGAEAQLDFYAAAMEAFGGRDEFFGWLDEQEDPEAALVELAEEYLGQEGEEDDEEDDDDQYDEPSDADLAFNEWLGETIGEDGIAQFQRLGEDEYQSAVEDLAEAFYAEHPEHADGYNFDDDHGGDDGYGDGG